RVTRLRPDAVIISGAALDSVYEVDSPLMRSGREKRAADRLDNGDRVHSPPFGEEVGKAGAQPPAQLNFVARGSRRQVDDGSDEARRESGPCLASEQRA